MQHVTTPVFNNNKYCDLYLKKLGFPLTKKKKRVRVSQFNLNFIDKYFINKIINQIID